VQEARFLALREFFDLTSRRNGEFIQQVSNEDDDTALEVIAGKHKCHSCDNVFELVSRSSPQSQSD
jgi:hypothetical protein